MYNLKAMDRLLLLVGLAILPFFSGCVPVPIGSEPPAELVDQSILDALIGEGKESILGTLGRPAAVLSSETSSYFIYGAHGDEYQILLMVWVPVAGQKYRGGKLFCVLLELDEENIFRRYRINLHSKNWSDIKSVSDCALSFFTPEELETFTTRDVELEDVFVEKGLQNRAEQGESEAQWQLYKRSKSRDEYDFKWLCTAAEQGDYRARWELGYLHLHGLYGIRKDLVLSVMWYSLVEAGGHDPKGVDNIRKQLSPEQLTRAQHLYEDWKPGRCEREIIRTEPNISN